MGDFLVVSMESVSYISSSRVGSSAVMHAYVRATVFLENPKHCDEIKHLDYPHEIDTQRGSAFIVIVECSMDSRCPRHNLVMMLGA